jgi:4-hydroxy-3-methylbut-2-enyl diphosphate reductase IspH
MPFLVRGQNRRAQIRIADTICQPTRERQQAVDRLLDKVDAKVVVGGKNSSNTRQLVERCRSPMLIVWPVTKTTRSGVNPFAGT